MTECVVTDCADFSFKESRRISNRNLQPQIKFWIEAWERMSFITYGSYQYHGN